MKYKIREIELEENEREQAKAKYEAWFSEVKPLLEEFYNLLRRYDECTKVYVYKVQCKYCKKVMTIRTAGGLPDKCPNCGARTKIHEPVSYRIDRDTWETMLAPSPHYEEWYKELSWEIDDIYEEERDKLREKIKQLISKMDEVCRKHGVEITRNRLDGIFRIIIDKGRIADITIDFGFRKEYRGYIWKGWNPLPLYIITFAIWYDSERGELLGDLEKILKKN